MYGQKNLRNGQNNAVPNFQKKIRYIGHIELYIISGTLEAIQPKTEIKLKVDKDLSKASLNGKLN